MNPARGRLRLHTRPIIAALMAVAMLTSCSSSKTKATARPAPASAQELEARLVTVVPAGFTLQADDVGDTGPSDLAKAVRDDGEPGAEEALRSEGFVRGFQRLWVGPGDAEIIVFVYQFGTAAGAEADYQRAKPRLTDVAPPGSRPFAVAGIPAGKSTAVAGSAPDLSAAIVVFTTGVFNVQVVCNGPELAGLQARASALAKDQYNRL